MHLQTGPTPHNDKPRREKVEEAGDCCNAAQELEQRDEGSQFDGQHNAVAACVNTRRCHQR